MRRSLVLVVMGAVVLGCGGAGSPAPQAGEPPPETPALAAAAQLIAVTARGDRSATRAMLHDTVGFGGVWFEDTTCRRQLSSMGTIQRAGLDVLARCLATLRLSRSERSNPYPDIAVLAYEPGLEIEVRFGFESGRTRVKWIGYVSRRVLKDALPTITQRALEAHRIEGSIAFDEATRGRIDKDLVANGLSFGEAWLKVCVGTSGAVASIHVRQTSSLALQQALAAAIEQWKLRPVILGGQPTPVCSLVWHDYPAGAASPQQSREFPFPVPTEYDTAIVVASSMLKRLEGSLLLVPDDHAKVWIQLHGISRVTGTFFVCITPRGTVDVAIVQRPTGVPRYDDGIVAAIRGWRYAPFLVDGRATPACTHLTVIYSQR